MDKPSKKRNLHVRYWWIFAFILLIAVGIISCGIKTSIIDKNPWDEKAQKMLHLDSSYVALPIRGSILAADGSPLAQTLAFYSLAIDFCAESIDDTLFMNVVHPDKSLPDTLYLDTICAFLARRYPQRTKEEYAAYITQKRNKGSRDCLLQRYLTEEQYDEIVHLPVVTRRLKSVRGKTAGFTNNRVYKRTYPFGDMASSLLGKASPVTAEMLEADSTRYRSKSEFHGTSGMEYSLDSILFGKYGTMQKQQMYAGFKFRIKESPVNGYDVRTTLDVTMQEIAERHLLSVVQKQEAAYGTAIVMEVATGAVKAMANVERTSSGGYTFHTRRNYAISCVEPGSVLKTLSLLIAMNRADIDANKEFDSSDAFPEIAGYKQLAGHKNPLSARDAIVISDNRGVCKVISDVYAGNYHQFTNDVRNSGIMQTMQIELPGAQRPRIPNITLKYPRNYYSFAQTVFGYYNEIPPLATLAVYNAIANDGKLMRPQLVSALEHDGVPDTVFAPVCINEHFCSPRNAAILRDMLHGVVYDAAGTAQRIKNGLVEIAGKTGTVIAKDDITEVRNGKVTYRSVYNDAERRLAFAGFFPYDNPQYSCIVVIDKPNLHSAGGVSGAVFRAIADEMYSRNLLQEHATYTTRDKYKNPPAARGDSLLAGQVYAYLRQYPRPDTAAVSRQVGVTVPVRCDSVPCLALMPSVVGLPARDALYTLEQRGVHVTLRGNGRVAAQSVAAGTPLSPGIEVELLLNESF